MKVYIVYRKDLPVVNKVFKGLEKAISYVIDNHLIGLADLKGLSKDQIRFMAKSRIFTYELE